MLPNFIVAGVAKAGTTSLYHYLIQHPEIDIPRKESFYFAREFYKNAHGTMPPHFREKSRIVFSEAEYDAFYEKCSKKAIGEVSTCYAYLYESSIPLIKKKLGDVKIIFLLRNPVDRAFSAYKHFARSQKEALTFKEALIEEESRIKMKWDFMWYYTSVGFYAKQVQAFKENFSKVEIFLTDDLSENHQEVMKKIFQFTGVDEHFKCDTSFHYNISAARHDKPLFNYLIDNKISKIFLKPLLKKGIREEDRKLLKHKLRTASSTLDLTMNAEIKAQLKNLYHDDIVTLQKAIQKDLDKWLY